jgi:hypothetical protein
MRKMLLAGVAGITVCDERRARCFSRNATDWQEQATDRLRLRMTAQQCYAKTQLRMTKFINIKVEGAAEYRGSVGMAESRNGT